MGILNVTPDSFSDGGRFDSRESAVSQALRMIDEGADFIDVGGESTRPGSDAVSLEDELRRVLPVVEAIAKRTIVPISIDTYKSEVAERALQAGACIINDISGMTFDDNMSHVAVEHHASVVLMHMQGTPRTMQQNPKYENVTREVKQFLKNRVKAARSAGIEQIIVDPGIGFGKNSEHNVQLIRELREFVEIGTPLLIGPSRKSFIGAILDLPVQERLEGTAAAVAVSVMNGAHILRVHDVKEMRRVAKVVDAFK
jgi:dihydropteroate synthase